MSIWKAIKDAFTPWNLLRGSSGGEHDGMRNVEFGQMVIDGTAGDGLNSVAPPLRAKPKPPSQPSQDKAEPRA